MPKINNYEAFKLVGKAKNEKDTEIYKKDKKLKALLLTSDKDFWNDQVFPLSESPGVVIIERNNLKDVKYCFGYFIKTLEYDFKVSIEHLEY